MENQPDFITGEGTALPGKPKVRGYTMRGKRNKPENKHKLPLKKLIYRDRHLLVMCIPMILFFLIFSYLPMVGLGLAFVDFKPALGITGSPFVGLENFFKVFRNPFFPRLMRNTFLIGLYTLVWSFPFPILFALAVNEIRAKKFQKVVQTISYMPYFISVVVIVGLLSNFLSPTTGIINQLYTAVTGRDPISFMTEPKYFRFLYVSSNIWQTFGWNSIIYLARKEKCHDIIQMTGAFIYLLQDSIHLGHSPLFARCENEAQVIRQYIIIQQYRYQDRFEFRMDFDKAAEGFYLPRNILQPLVENSLIHGICTDDKPGTITLGIHKLSECLEILVQDNGIGMEQEYADKLLLSPVDSDADRRARVRPIGINNIADRLNYLFPDSHEFQIKSAVGKGTLITIHIPLVDNPDSLSIKTVFSDTVQDSLTV